MTRTQRCFLFVGIAGICVPNALFAQSSTADLPDAPSYVAFSERWNPAAVEEPAAPAEADTGTQNDSGQMVSSEHHHGDPASERQVSWHSLPKDFLHDQKGIWLFPTQLAKGKHWMPTIAITGVTAGLIVADPHAMPYFQKHQRNLDDIDDIFATSATAAEIVALPATLMAVGYARHDQYQVGTALLAGEAYADATIVDLVAKAITRRQRPSDVAQNGNFNDTFFNGGKSPFKGSSFPSGHAVGAFSVATVVAKRYHSHKWVPFVAYGFAGLVGLSRVSTLSHFPSDVFLGAALGYTIATYSVLQPR